MERPRLLHVSSPKTLRTPKDVREPAPVGNLKPVLPIVAAAVIRAWKSVPEEGRAA